MADDRGQMSDVGTAPAPQEMLPPAQPNTDQAPAYSSEPAQAVAPSSGPVNPPAPVSKWHNVVQGALAGLVSRGIPGAVAGAIEPDMAQQNLKNKAAMQQANVNNTNAEFDVRKANAANLMVDAMYRHKQLDMMDEQSRMAHQKIDESLNQTFLNRGMHPAIVTEDDSPDKLNAALKQWTDQGMPTPIITRMGKGYALWNADGMASNDSSLRDVNLARKAQGLSEHSGDEWNNKNKISAGQRTKEIVDATKFWQQDDPKAIERYQNYVAGVKKLPDTDPDKAPLLEKLSDTVNALQASNKRIQAEKVAQAGARGAAYNATKPQNVIDENGNLVIRPAGVAEANNLTPAAQGVKAAGQTAAINDIETGSASMRQAIQNLDKSFSPAQIAQLTLATHSNDEKVISAAMTGLMRQNLTPAQKKFVVSVNQLNERALTLRSVAGMGQGSDMMRQAIQRMVPGASSGDRDFMTQQLDAFDQQVGVLKGGVPKVQGLNKTAGAPDKSEKKADPFAQFGGQRRQ